MTRVLLAALLLVPQDPAPDVELLVLGDAWPRAPRSAGQKFGMNTRDTIATELLDADDDAPEALPGNVTKWRIVGVRLRNRRDAAVEGTLASPQIPNLQRDVRLRPGESARLFFAVPDAKGKVRFELKGPKAEILATAESILDPQGKTGLRSEAALIVAELEAEQATRARFERAARTVEVRDESNRPLRDARLTFVHPKTGMIAEGRTNSDGVWSGPLLAGEWQVFARAVVEPEKPAAGTTVSISNPRIYYLGGTMAGTRARLAPDQSASIFPPGDRLAVVPSAFADFLRYETVHARLGPLFLLNLAPPVRGQPVFLHSTAGLPFDLSSWTAPPNASFARLQKVAAKGSIAFERPKGCALSFDPAKLPGSRLDVRLSFPDAPREVYAFQAGAAVEVAVPPGPVRVELTVAIREGKIRFAPHLVDARQGRAVELCPAAFRLSTHFQDTRGLMLWVALEDELGKVVTRLEGIAGSVAGTYRGQAIFKEALKTFTFHWPSRFDKLDRADVRYDAEIEIAGRKVEFHGRARPRKDFPEPPGSVVVPENLEARARAMLPTIRKTLEGSRRFLGAQKFDLKVRFEIRLPPEVGGMGGGGIMLLDLGEILEYAHETDRLPGAYTHELGHNLGYGHDPYMTMAPCSHEGLFGTPGYLFLHGFAPARLLAYLDRDEDAKEWAPSGELFPALRMLYGSETHARMFALRKRFAERLDRAGLSISEQMAAYYSTVTGANLAWMFRAFGWPVFDYRVRLAQAMIQQQELASQGKLPSKIDGSFLTTWWVRGPKPPWKLHAWQGRFLLLATEENFLRDAAYRFHLAVQSLEDQLCLLSIASDVQVAFYLNGKRVSRVAAAPQFSQPVHEGWTMERANATVVPVILLQGENTLEMVVAKPAGSKGMWIEMANGFGKPLQTVSALTQKAPEDADPEKVVHPVFPPVFNPSFEAGLASWIAAAKDGDGELAVSIDEKIPRDGKKCLRLEAKGALSGGIIQRLVLEENATYEFSGWIHTDGFNGKTDRAFVGLFAGSPTEGMIVQTEAIDRGVPGWQRVAFKYRSDRRAVYIGCMLRAGDGAKAWFDGLQLVRVR